MVYLRHSCALSKRTLWKCRLQVSFQIYMDLFTDVYGYLFECVRFCCDILYTPENKSCGTAKIPATSARYGNRFLWRFMGWEISRFAIASLASPLVFRFSNCVHNGHSFFKGQNITGLMCTSGYDEYGIAELCCLYEEWCTWEILDSGVCMLSMG